MGPRRVLRPRPPVCAQQKEREQPEPSGHQGEPEGGPRGTDRPAQAEHEEGESGDRAEGGGVAGTQAPCVGARCGLAPGFARAIA